MNAPPRRSTHGAGLGTMVGSIRRVLLIVAFVTVLLAVLLAGHFYLAHQLVWAPAWPEPWRTLGLGLIGLGAGLLVLQPIAERTLAPRRGRWIAWPASLWMGFAFLLLMLNLAGSLVQTLVAAVEVDGADGPAGARVLATVVTLVALVAGGKAVRTARRGPILERREVRLRRWPAALDGFRIVQISDLHIGPILDASFAADVVARCNALAPDLVAVTGDLVDGDVGRVGDEVAPLAALRARHGVYFVTGNHDFYSGADAWAARVERLGWRPLRNARVAIERDGAGFDLAGVEDHHAHLVSGRHREDLRAALAGRDADRPVLLLAHDPQTFTRAAAMGVDLQLSGHTHGGQIWPFRYLVRLSTPYVAGLYRVNGSQLYVSRGTGFWGPVMRLFAPAEITELTLRRG